MNHIKSISFLDKDENRQRLYVDERTGYFHYRLDNGLGTPRYQTYGVSAVMLIEAVKDGDPVLELDSGNRVRVYQGGHPDGVRIDALCICESHDKYYLSRRGKGVIS